MPHAADPGSSSPVPIPDLRLPSPLTELHDPRLSASNTRVWLKRDDLIHPLLPGNKWRKLRLNIDDALAAGPGTILTFGGAYSNHLRAVAAAGRMYGVRTIGVVRGEEHLPLNPSLAFAVEQGMTLTYLDRMSYRRKHTGEVLDGLRAKWGDVFVIPEGGANAAGVRGCADIPSEIDIAYDVLVCPLGTGTTLAGVAAGLPSDTEAVGVCVLKGAGYLDGEVARLQGEAFGGVTGNWRVEHRFHHGGFAKSTPELAAFATEYEQRHGHRLEDTYVAKALYAVLVGGIGVGRRVVVLVTG